MVPGPTSGPEAVILLVGWKSRLTENPNSGNAITSCFGCPSYESALCGNCRAIRQGGLFVVGHQSFEGPSLSEHDLSAKADNDRDHSCFRDGSTDG